MKNIQKQGKESGKVQIALLIAVVLAAGGTGVWSNLHAAGATVAKSAGSAVYASGNGIGDIEDNGDGTGFTAAIATLPDGSMLNGFDFANPDYSVSATVHPGQSGKGTGSGTASATINGNIISPDWSTFTPTILQVDVAVGGTTDVSAYLQQGITVSINPLTGESSVNRVHSVGNQATGDTAGAFSISVDGSVAYEETGVFGGVSAYSQHSVVRIK
jgi:hypothetical protein